MTKRRLCLTLLHVVFAVILLLAFYELKAEIDYLNSSLARIESKTSLESQMLPAPVFDSSWIDITDKAGQYFEVAHNLNTTEVVIEITGRVSADEGVHQRNLGAVNYVAGWSINYGGGYDEETYSLVKTADGGYAMAGYTYSYGSGLSDFWLVKTTAHGTVEWSKTYGSAQAEVAYSLVQTADGGYAIVGSTYSYGAGEFDLLLIKTDSRGEVQWNRTYGGIKVDFAYSLIQTEDRGFAIAGSTDSYGNGGEDFWLVKTDSHGNMQWNKTFGGRLNDYAYSIIQTDDGGYALCGGSHSFGSMGYNFWLVKTNNAGEMQWNGTYGGYLNDWARAMIQTKDGDYVLAGSTSQFFKDSDFMCVCVDYDGKLLWSKTYGGPADEEAYSIIQSLDGGYAVAGYTESFGFGDCNFWLVKIDPDGNVQWNKTYGGSSFDCAFCLTQAVDGGFVAAGRTDSFGITGSDFWLIKTDVEIGLAWINTTSNSIILYRGETDFYWNYIRIRFWKTED